MITFKGILKSIGVYSLWKTLYFNLKCFPFAVGRKLPVYIGRKVEFKHLDGTCSIIGNVRHGMVRIGTRDMGIQDLDAIRTIIDLRRGGGVLPSAVRRL